jgi:hypothetical protein
MPILFATNDASDIGGEISVSTSTLHYDGTLLSKGMQVPVRYNGATSVSVVLPKIAVSDTTWFHFACYLPNATLPTHGNSDGDYLFLQDSNGLNICGIDILDGYHKAVSYGASTTPTIGTPNYSFPVDALARFDIKVVVNASNVIIEVYLNGALVSSVTTTNARNLGKPKTLMFTHDDFTYNSGTMGYSEFIITDNEPTIGWRLSQLNATTAGQYSEWDGVPASVADDDPVTQISSDLAGERMTWNLSAYAGPQNSPSIRALVTTSYGQKGTTGPQNLKHMTRIGSVDYESPVLAMANSGFGTLVNEWSVNPATGAPWTKDDLTGLQIGVKSES